MHLSSNNPSSGQLTAAETPRIIPNNYYPDQMRVSVCRDRSCGGERTAWLSVSRVSHVTPVKTSIYTVKGQNVRPSQVTLRRSKSPHAPKIRIRYQSPPSSNQIKYNQKLDTYSPYYTKTMKDIRPQQPIIFKQTPSAQKTPISLNIIHNKSLQKSRVHESLISTKRSIEQSTDFNTPLKNLFGSRTDLTESQLRFSKITNKNERTMAESFEEMHPFQSINKL